MTNREALDQWSERAILGLVLAILTLTPLAFGGRPQPPAGVFLDFLLLDPFQLAQWLMVIVLVAWGVRVWVNPRLQFFWPPICWAVVAFALYAIARYAFADIEYVARQEMIRVIVYALLFFVILNNLHRQESVHGIVVTLVFLAMTISLYAVYQFLTDSTRVWHVFTSYNHRASGTYICPNHLGGLLEILVPLGLTYTVASRFKPLGKVFLGYATLTMLGGIAATVSRGTFIGAGAALLFCIGALLLHSNYRLPALVLLLAVVGGGLLFLPRNYSLQARYSRWVMQGKLEDDLRFAMWEPALEVWQENVWWGAGPDHFDYRFRQHRPEVVQKSPDRVHNDILNALADWGVAGTALVFAAWALLAAGVVKTWRAIRRNPEDFLGRRASNKFAFVLGASAGLLAILLHSVVDFNMHIPANAMVAVALMALLSTHLRFATERYWVRAGTWTKILATAMLLTGITYLGQQGVRRAEHNYWMARAARAPDFSPVQAALYEKAFAVEPADFDAAYGIGEAYRVQSHEGGENYKELAAKAMEWFARGMKLNPWDGYNFLRYGTCLDWVGRQEESGPYFDRAEQLDPNGYFTIAFIGLHYVQLNDYAAARAWFERSLSLEWNDNPIARSYLNIANRKLAEGATNEISAKIHVPSP
jgi:O-antigen ligase